MISNVKLQNVQKRYINRNMTTDCEGNHGLTKVKNIFVHDISCTGRANGSMLYSFYHVVKVTTLVE